MSARSLGRQGLAKPPSRLLFLSAFSGIGGIDLGLERAGLETLGAIELDPVARASLALNRPRLHHLAPYEIGELARELRPERLGIHSGELAVLAAGPPCQPFSKAAQWSPQAALGLHDPRASCLDGLLKLLERLLPHALLIENVPGFVRGPSSALGVLEARLAEVNCRCGTHYRVSVAVIDAADYGVPQHRRRAILVALRNGDELRWPSPTHAGRPVRAWDALRSVRPSIVPPIRGRYARLLPSVPEGRNYLYFTDRGEGPPLFGYRRRYWSFLLKLAKARPAWTLQAHPGPSTGPFHWDSRPLAPEEMLRLQSFPPSWRLSGSYREQVRQAGNATPPLLVEVIGRAIASQLFGMRYDRPLALRIPRASSVPPPTPPRPVPWDYLALAGKHQAHPGTGRGPAPRGMRKWDAAAE